jgi:hypothetical protein
LLFSLVSLWLLIGNFNIGSVTGFITVFTVVQVSKTVPILDTVNIGIMCNQSSLRRVIILEILKWTV